MLQHKSYPPDIIAIGASAGGVEAIPQLLKRLPRNLPASILVVLHRPIAQTSHLLEILARNGRHHVVIPGEGEALKHGICYLGEPDMHLVVGPDTRFHLLPDHFYRAHNIDALFSSLAQNAGKRTIGVILSGALKDGSFGLRAIKYAGGIAMVQSPEEAQYPDMPLNAIKHDGPVDLIAPIDDLAMKISRPVGAGPHLTHG